MDAKGGVDPVGGQFGGAVDDGEIALLDLSKFELFRDFPLGHVVLGDDHDTGGIAVEAMDDSGAELAEPAGELFGIVREGVDQGAVLVAPGGMDDQVGRLIEDDQIVIFVDHVEGDVFGLDLLLLGLGEHELDHVAVAELEAGFDGLTVDLDGSGLDGILDEMPAEVAETAVQVLVDPPLAYGDAHMKRQRLTIDFGQLTHGTSVNSPPARWVRVRRRPLPRWHRERRRGLRWSRAPSVRRMFH